MTDEQYKKLAKGDHIDLSCVVSGISESRETVTLVMDDNYHFTLPRLTILRWATPSFELFPPTRRLFKKGDLVRWKNWEYIVAESEDVEGNMVLTPSYLGAGMPVTADQVQLLMPANEVEKLPEWKTGERE